MINPEFAVIAAKNYRILRSGRITIRKTIDLLIGTFYIAHEDRLQSRTESSVVIELQSVRLYKPAR
jgi:hypothetical protein